MNKTNLYEILGLKPDATQDEIKKAYRNLSKTMHPDKGGKPEDFRNLALAYEVLKDQERRKLYDETGTIENLKGEDAAEVMNLCVQTFMGVFNNTENVDLIDIVGECKKTLEVGIQKAAKAIQSADGELEKIGKVQANLKKTGNFPCDFLAIVLEDGKREFIQQKENIQKQIDNARKALALYENYDYDFVKQITSYSSFRTTPGTSYKIFGFDVS